MSPPGGGVPWAAALPCLADRVLRTGAVHTGTGLRLPVLRLPVLGRAVPQVGTLLAGAYVGARSRLPEPVLLLCVGLLLRLPVLAGAE